MLIFEVVVIVTPRFFNLISYVLCMRWLVPHVVYPYASLPASTMPKPKTNCRRLKKIRCPWCGKKFHSETNVLQHMNQPTGLCFTSSWHDDRSKSLHQVPEDDLPFDPHLDPLDSSHLSDFDSNMEIADSTHLDSDHPCPPSVEPRSRSVGRH
jgi:hypothetical protein